MYAGEVNVAQDQLPQFLKTAERLKVYSQTHISSDYQSLIEWNQTLSITYFQVKGLAEAPQNVKDE